MELKSKNLEHPGVSAEEDVSNELVTRIRKLRWMGMEEEEAEQLENLLHRSRPADVLCPSPCDTD